MSDVYDALEVAAGADLVTGPSIGAARTVGPQQIGRLRKSILRFLDNIDEGMTVHELREELTQCARSEGTP